MRDEFLGQRRAPRAVIDGVGKLMCSGGAALIQKHINHRQDLVVVQQRGVLLSDASFNTSFIAAKTVRPVHGGIPDRRLRVIRRQYHHAAHVDGPAPESGERGTNEIEPLGVLRKLRWGRRSDALAEGKLELRILCRIEPFDRYDFRVNVAGGGEMICGVVVDVEQRHRVVIPGRRGGERSRKRPHVSAYLDTAARLKILHFLRRNPDLYFFLWCKDGSARWLRAEHYNHAA